jgi:hypothetical protein
MVPKAQTRGWKRVGWRGVRGLGFARATSTLNNMMFKHFEVPSKSAPP